MKKTKKLSKVESLRLKARSLRALRGWDTRKRKAEARSERARKGWEIRRGNERESKRQREEKKRQAEAEARSERARKGWETRRGNERKSKRQREEKKRQAEAEARSERARKGWKTRRKKEKIDETVEPVGIPIEKILFDGHAEDPPIEHFWSNLRYLQGNSISNEIARVLAESGNMRVSFRLVDADVLSRRSEEAELDEFGEGGDFDVSWETDLDLNEFWRTYFDNAREHLPITKEGKSDGTKSLLVVKMVLTYVVGQVSAD